MPPNLGSRNFHANLMQNFAANKSGRFRATFTGNGAGTWLPTAFSARLPLARPAAAPPDCCHTLWLLSGLASRDRQRFSDDRTVVAAVVLVAHPRVRQWQRRLRVAGETSARWPSTQECHGGAGG